MESQPRAAVAKVSAYTPVASYTTPLKVTAPPKHACVDQLVTIALNSASYGAALYEWDFDGGQIVFGEHGGPFGLKWSVPDTGKQIVTSRAIRDGCYSLLMRDSIIIHDYPVANILSDPNEICAYDTVTLIAEQNAVATAATYVWGPADRVVDAGTTDGVVSIVIPGGASGYSGLVSLTVTTPWGCSSYDSAYVATRSCCEVGVPTAFSPNGDGRNDQFRLVTEGRQQIEVFRILNRWGQVVFETADSRAGWDGTYNGRPQDMGTYMFYARYRCADGSLSEKQGEVTLVR